MRDFSKRQYLKYAGLGLAAMTLGVGGTAGSVAARHGAPVDAPLVAPQFDGRILDYERDDDGEVQFDFRGIRFRTSDDDIDLDDVDSGVSFETNRRDDHLQLLVDRGGVQLDLDVADDGDRIDLTMAVGDEYLDFEFDDRDREVDLTVSGSGVTFEDASARIEYQGDAITLDWDGDDGDLDISGDVSLRLRTDRRDIDFEYRDDDVAVDFRDEELDYVGEDVTIEWRMNRGRRDDDFEARLRR
ncbi:hypothetical protein ACFO0N_08030 [Halobium salinum]|uniref:Adhesin domain-containing protein n=1 Tax=Halobium salinum TaxID=1364940 RepID=A0ABD5PAH0_9EURY|nr:hypothetical protein [Halobium salinum]